MGDEASMTPAVGAEWAAVIEQEALNHLADLSAKPPAGPFVEVPQFTSYQDFERLWRDMARMEIPWPTPKYELRCAPDVIVALQQVYPPAPDRDWIQFGHLSNVAGMPVIPNEELASGCWELYADGELVQAGTIVATVTASDGAEAVNAEMRLGPGPSCSSRERARNRHSRMHGLLDWLRRRQR